MKEKTEDDIIIDVNYNNVKVYVVPTLLHVDIHITKQHK